MLKKSAVHAGKLQRPRLHNIHLNTASSARPPAANYTALQLLQYVFKSAINIKQLGLLLIIAAAALILILCSSSTSATLPLHNDPFSTPLRYSAGRAHQLAFSAASNRVVQIITPPHHVIEQAASIPEHGTFSADHHAETEKEKPPQLIMPLSPPQQPTSNPSPAADPIATDKGEKDEDHPLHNTASESDTRVIHHHETPFMLGPKVTDWDEQRLSWLAQNPKFVSHNGRPRILLVTGSRPRACENPSGDRSLLIFMKNKVDYCRMHGIEIFYNMAQLNSEMAEYWSKLPLLRTLMLSHPEMEWLWWMDSDAMITDMAFDLPMEKYEHHNLIIPGNREDVFIRRSWIGLNAGIFLIRNCQWSLDLIDTWARMGPKGKVGQEVGKILSEALPDRPLFDSDDQSSLIYLLLTQKEIWDSKVVFEQSYTLHGYWIGIVDRFEELAETSHPGYGDDRWPFVTHFVGCKPCARYPSYEQERCFQQMERAFNFADNQVLQHYGFQHKHLNTGEVERRQGKASFGIDIR